MMRVGYIRDTYAEKRVIINKSPLSKYLDVAKLDSNTCPEFFNDEERINSSKINTDHVHLVHFFNNINFGATPYITTFETIAPRYWNESAYTMGLNVIAKDTCRKLVALSDAAHALHSKRIEASAISLKKKEAILEKTVTVHPPQYLIENDQGRFRSISELRCLFIGNGFFFKGGHQLLRVMHKLKHQGYPVQLTIVSDMAVGYNPTESTQKDWDDVASLIAQNRDWINFYHDLPNEDVLRLITLHHLGFLPSFGDTYGYCVLEMQAAGVPVVTTAIRALPEINNNECGWIIDHPPMNFNVMHPREKIALMRIVEVGLEKTIINAFENKDILLSKSKAAMERILQFHNPQKYGATMQEMYDQV